MQASDRSTGNTPTCVHASSRHRLPLHAPVGAIADCISGPLPLQFEMLVDHDAGYNATDSDSLPQTTFINNLKQSVTLRADTRASGASEAGPAVRRPRAPVSVHDLSRLTQELCWEAAKHGDASQFKPESIGLYPGNAEGTVALRVLFVAPIPPSTITMVAPHSHSTAGATPRQSAPPRASLPSGTTDAVTVITKGLPGHLSLIEGIHIALRDAASYGIRADTRLIEAVALDRNHAGEPGRDHAFTDQQHAQSSIDSIDNVGGGESLQVGSGASRGWEVVMHGVAIPLDQHRKVASTSSSGRLASMLHHATLADLVPSLCYPDGFLYVSCRQVAAA